MMLLVLYEYVSLQEALYEADDVPWCVTCCSKMFLNVVLEDQVDVAA